MRKRNSCSNSATFVRDLLGVQCSGRMGSLWVATDLEIDQRRETSACLLATMHVY